MNSGDVVAICTAGTLAFSILCAVIKGIVDGAVSKKFAEQQRYLSKEFNHIREWQNNHVKDSHGPARTRR